jgi:hypothetical protein
VTFRDDHDAALARADALAAELERTRQERDALREKGEALEAELANRPLPREQQKTVERARSSGAPSSTRKAWLWGIVGALAFVSLITALALRDRRIDQAREAWAAKREAREAYRRRWVALKSVEPCVRQVALAAVTARRYTPDKVDPRTQIVWPFTENVAGNCLDGTRQLADDPALAPAARTALRGWVSVQRELAAPLGALAVYYDNGDWKEDNFASAPALWAPVLALLARQLDALATVRRDALPPITAELRGMQQAHEQQHGRDETWWRLELGLGLRAIADRSFDAGGVYAGRELDEGAAGLAVRGQVVDLLRATEQAPIELRRIIRKVDWITEPLVQGTPPRGEQPLWHLANLEGDLIGAAVHDHVPALPPDPGPQPEPSE